MTSFLKLFAAAIVLLAGPAGAQEIAYTLIDHGAVNTTYTYNPYGTVEVTPSGGAFHVKFNGVFGTSGQGGDGHVQVSAHGPGTDYCNATGWELPDVFVTCFNTAGAVVQAPYFKVVVIRKDNDRNISYAMTSDAFGNTAAAWSASTAGTEITRTGFGLYTVKMPGLSSGGHVQVTSGGDAYCYVVFWVSDGARVRCDNPAGSPTNSSFLIASLPQGAAPREMAYAQWMFMGNYVYNSSGGNVTVNRTSAGQYDVTFSNLDTVGLAGGSVLVSRYIGSSTLAGIYCRTDGWGNGGGADLVVHVRCYTASGTPTDSQFTILAIPPPAPVTTTITTSPILMSVTVDGTTYSAPKTFTFTPGSTHTISVPSEYTDNFDNPLTFSNWSDSGARQHTITAPAVNTTFTANYQQFYLLSLGTNPNSGGTISRSPASDRYLPGTQVQITATPNPGYTFTGFSEAITGTANPQTVIMSQRRFITAHFACAYSFSNSGGNFAAGGGSLTVTVNAGATCNWTLTGLPAWLSATPSTGPGTKTVTLQAQANSGGTRNATLTLGSATYPVSQAGIPTPTCTYGLSNTVATFNAEGSGGAVNIITQAGCAWSVLDLPSWITANATTGTGPSTFNYTVQANPSTANRVAAMTIGGVAYTVSQSANVAPSSAGLRFVRLTPCRVMETRPEYNNEGRALPFGPPFLNSSETRTLNLPASSTCPIPATAKAYVLNVTVIPRGPLDFVTVWPAGETRPNVWSVRSPDGQVVANSSIIKAGIAGGINIFTSNNTDMILDITGYFTDNPAVSNLVYYPVSPCRVIETRVAYRPTPGPFGGPSMNARQTRSFRFPQSPDCAIPSGAAAYNVTITIVPPGPLPFLTAWPSGSAQPNVSSINSFVGRTLANNVIIPAGPDGGIDVFTLERSDFIMDITGYFAPDDGVNGLFYYPTTQCRASDSTNANWIPPFGTPIFENETTRTIPIRSGACLGIPASARAYALNTTVIPNGSSMPFLTIYPTGQGRPNASVLNAFEGQTVTNSSIIPAGTGGAVDVFAFRRTHVVVEINGYFGR